MRKKASSDKAPVPRRDTRPTAIGSVWGGAVAMLALCIPLVAVMRSSILPVLVIAGAALVSLYIWQSGSTSREADTSEADALREKIKELEERLANVEVINRFEDRLAEKRLQQETGQAGTPPRVEEQT